MPRRHLPRPVRGLILDLGAFLFPFVCVVCREGLPPRWPVPLCAPCRRRLVPVTGPTCLLCRTATRDTAGFMAGRTCRDPEHAAYTVHAAVQMIDPADRLVHALKFHDRPEVGALMALFMARRLRREGRGFWDAVVPMPLHATRQRARGYNQSAEIGTRLARSLGGVLLPQALGRVRATRPQADLDHASRSANVSGAFRPAASRRVEGLSCLLVDDVATTGHTLVAAIDALRPEAPAATGAAVFALA